jgi:hypothetical protein
VRNVNAPERPGEVMNRTAVKSSLQKYLQSPSTPKEADLMTLNSSLVYWQSGQGERIPLRLGAKLGHSEIPISLIND